MCGGLGPSESGYGPVVGYCRHANEPSGSINSGQMRYYELHSQSTSLLRYQHHIHTFPSLFTEMCDRLVATYVFRWGFASHLVLG